MTQSIDPIRLKAAAEHLEWVLRQYPESEEIEGLLSSLVPLIQDAKVGAIEHPIEKDDVPCAFNFSEGMYVLYSNPSVNDAYTRFRSELNGGLTDRAKLQIARLSALRQDGWPGVEP